MAKAKAGQAQSAYDPRWFIWTIVFLIAAGFSLVSYLTIQGYNDSNVVIDFSAPHSIKR